MNGSARPGPRLPGRMFAPLGVYITDDGGEWLIRDHAGQTGRFCVIGPWTCDILASFRAMSEACGFIEKRAGDGSWEYRSEGMDQGVEP